MLARLSPLVFPCERIETVFSKLLLECVLPLAQRIHAVEETWPPHASTGVPQLLEQFNAALQSLFQFYAKLSHLKMKDRASAQRHRSATATATATATAPAAAAVSPSADKNNNTTRNQHHHRPDNSVAVVVAAAVQHNRMLYSEFHRFATDFGLCAPQMLSTLEVGDLFHTAVSLPVMVMESRSSRGDQVLS